MPYYPTDPAPIFRAPARAAGLCHLGIILLGLSAEIGLRGELREALGAPEAALARLQLSVAADLGMLMLDAVLAVLLYRMLRPAGETLALMAMVLRLAQMAMLGGNLLPLAAATGADQIPALLARHAAGYDLALVFFGLSLLFTGQLLCRSRQAPQVLAAGLSAAGLVYLTGSFSRLLAPGLNAMLQPAYLLPLLAESAFCLWLLLGAPVPQRQAQAA